VPLGAIQVVRAAPGSSDSVFRERVSVIIPCYRQAHFLGDALTSVAAQSVAATEVIVVDDGSPDNAAEVARRYAGVRTIIQRNAGLAGARNTGLLHSTGDYLVFLDSDDRLLPGALEAGLRSLTRRPECGFTYGRWRLIGSDGSPLPAEEQSLPEDCHYRALLHMCFIWTPAAVMYRRSAIAAAGGFNTAVNASADYDLYLRMTRTTPVHGHGNVVAEYRRHGANMTLNPAVILSSELAVLRAQWPYVRHDAELREAWRAGVCRARAHHGTRLISAVRSLASMGEWRPMVKGSLRLLRQHPRGLLPLTQPLVHATRSCNGRRRIGGGSSSAPWEQ